jgi:peroxiredoxin
MGGPLLLSEGFHSGCTIEAKNFQRDIEAYEKVNAVTRRASIRLNLTIVFAPRKACFKLLADTDVKVSTAYGSVMEYGEMKLSARNTFIIDPKGNIAKVFPAVKVQKHSEEVLWHLPNCQLETAKARRLIHRGGESVFARRVKISHFIGGLGGSRIPSPIKKLVCGG